MTYEEQLATNEWALKRQEILERDQYKCTKCGAGRPEFRNMMKSFGLNSIAEMAKEGYVFVETSPQTYHNLQFKKGDRLFKATFIGETDTALKLADLKFAFQKVSYFIKELGKVDSYHLLAFYPEKHRDVITVDHNIHHKYYIDGRSAWDYGNDALVTLCVPCHKEVHNTTEIFTYSESGDKLYLNEVCGKCDGSGYLAEYNYYQNGVCFSCNGEGVIRIKEK